MDDELGFVAYFVICIGIIIYGIYSLYLSKTVKPTTFTVVEVKETWRESDRNNNIDYYANLTLEDSDKRQYDYCYKSDNSPNLPEKGKTISNLYMAKGKIKKKPTVLKSLIFILWGVVGILIPIILFYQDYRINYKDKNQ